MNLKNKNILVTGGAGFIPSHLVDRLIIEKPKRLVVQDNFFMGKMENLENAKKNLPSLKIYKHSLTDYKKTKQIISENNIDVVFNLAVVPLPLSLIKPEWVFNEITQMTLNLCKLAREDAFKTLIHFSSSEAYGTAQKVPMSEEHPLVPRTAYAAGKASADHIVMAYCNCFGIDMSIIRPFNNYGPRQNEKTYAGVIPLTIKRIKQHKNPIIYGDGRQTRDFIYVKDTVDAAIKVYNSKNTRGKILNMATRIIDLVKEIMNIMDCKKKIKFEAQRIGDVRRHCADISLAKKLINFKPNIFVKEGLKKTVDWYESQLTQ